MYDKFKKYKVYADDCLKGKVVCCELVKLACKRYLDFFNKYTFRSDKVDKVINVISKLKHSVGSASGKFFKLEEFQKFIIYNIFGFYYKDQPDKRVTNYVYIELARKNGKTALIASILIYLMVADGEDGAEIELVANSAKQAKICFDMCSNYCHSIDRKDKIFKRYRDRIKFSYNNSMMQILSSDAGGNDGYNSYAFCLDEAHEQPDSKLFDVMTSSQGARKNPLAIIITTAGFNRFGFCYQYRQTCVEILNNLKDNDSQFTAIYTQDDNDDWKDGSVWKKSNPNLDVTVYRDYLQQQVLNATNNTSLETGIKTKNFNIWCNTLDTWIADDYILKATEKVDLSNYKEMFCYCGIDLASVSDLTAVSVMIQRESKYIFKTFYYLPQTALTDNANKELYKLWKRQGYLTITSGNVTDYDYILKDLLEVQKICYIDKIAYDAYNATQFAINATTAGLQLEPYSQALWNFNKPTKELERLLKSGKVVIDDNPITRFCFRNVTLKLDHNNNCKPVKTSSLQKIDGVISMIECLGIYLEQPQYQQQIFSI